MEGKTGSAEDRSASAKGLPDDFEFKVQSCQPGQVELEGRLSLRQWKLLRS